MYLFSKIKIKIKNKPKPPQTSLQLDKKNKNPHLVGSKNVPLDLLICYMWTDSIVVCADNLSIDQLLCA